MDMCAPRLFSSVEPTLGTSINPTPSSGYYTILHLASHNATVYLTCRSSTNAPPLKISCWYVGVVNVSK